MYEFIATHDVGLFPLCLVTVLALRFRAVLPYVPYRGGSKRVDVECPAFHAQMFRRNWWHDAIGIVVACFSLIFVFFIA